FDLSVFIFDASRLQETFTRRPRDAATNPRDTAATWGLTAQRSRATATIPKQTTSQGTAMPKFVIERNIPGAGKLTAAELKAISQKSCGVLSDVGPSIQWIQSYVTGDKIYCIYQAPMNRSSSSMPRWAVSPPTRSRQ